MLVNVGGCVAEVVFVAVRMVEMLVDVGSCVTDVVVVS